MDDETPGHQPVKDAHKALGMWSIRRALTFAFSASTILLIGAWFLVSWLLGSPRHAPPEPLNATAQLELLKLVFALVAGAGALVALVTAYRRQRVDEAAGERAERTQAHVEYVAFQAAHDATERRVTDLYGQAVEQLGHDKAAVRLGGLYSLERLAQDHPQHRQTVTDVVCAYLRMSYESPRQSLDEEATPNLIPSQDRRATDSRQELQVRLTAQRFLRRHLIIPDDQEPPATYWDNVVIDLTNALLIDFDFAHCKPKQAIFTSARFSGYANFAKATFCSGSGFDLAIFDGPVRFDEARFSGYALFDEVTFNSNSDFGQVNFEGPALFSKTTFHLEAVFNEAIFNGPTEFKSANFGGGAQFNRANFRIWARFDNASFGGEVRFNNVTFNSDCSFSEAIFDGPARFDEVTFPDDAFFDMASFNGPALFNGAIFEGNASFEMADFSMAGRFNGAFFNGTARFFETTFVVEPEFINAVASHPNVQHVWPTSWRAQTQPSPAGMVQLIREHDGSGQRPT